MKTDELMINSKKKPGQIEGWTEGWKDGQTLFWWTLWLTLGVQQKTKIAAKYVTGSMYVKEDREYR